jgi:hypothetical protein
MGANCSEQLCRGNERTCRSMKERCNTLALYDKRADWAWRQASVV